MSKKILFTGYAPVHFLCFRPLYERLAATEGFEVFVSGGLRTKTDDGLLHDGLALYAPFGIRADRILSVAEIKERDFDMLFAANSTLISPRTAGTRVQIFHGISFRNRAIRAQNMACDAYFLIGPYMRRLFGEAGLLQDGDPRGVEIGFLKTDRLLDGQLEREDLLRQYGFDGTRPVILYAPTGEKYNSLETMGENVLGRLSGSGKYDVLIKLHDHPKNDSVDWSSRMANLEDEHTRLVREFDVIPPLFLSDVLITDASSVSNEYSLLDRPIVFLDVPKLLRHAIERRDSRVDMDTWGRRAGQVVERPAGIVAAVEASLAEPGRHSDLRRAMARDLFYNPGRATEAAITWVSRVLQ